MVLAVKDHWNPFALVRSEHNASAAVQIWIIQSR